MKIIRLFVTTAVLLCGVVAHAQTLTGHIYDKETDEPLPGVNVVFTNPDGTKNGAVSDVDGAYSIKVPARGIDVLFSSLGYENKTLNLVFSQNENKVQDIYMELQSALLDEVVVSASRFEQKLSDITVSMDLLKGEQIAKQSPSDLSATLNTLPGVDINDKQPSIRGGNGWTYGVGSRCMVLIDGMNALDPGNGILNWNTLPVENIDQVEVMKGASSVLYGSSALNGIINIRSRRPSLEPKTTLRLYTGIYGNPANPDYNWSGKEFWKLDKFPVQALTRQTIFSGVRNPLYEGADLSHSRRIGNFDVSGSMNIFTDEGYRQQGFNKRFRIGGNLTYHQPMKSDVKLVNYGFNINYLSDQSADFFLWRSPSEVYMPSAFTNMGRQGNTVDLNPFFNFTNTEKNMTHKLKARFFYKDDNIMHPSQPKDIASILGNMGTDFEKITSTINQVKGGDYSIFIPILAPILRGDLGGFVNNTVGTLNGFFPQAGTADYCDLLAWVMQNGLPKDQASLVPWLSGVISPQPAETLIDRHYSYYLDYQFNKKWKSGACLTTGLTYEHTRLASKMTGYHDSDNAALFLQYDQRFLDKISVSAGMRMEYYRVDEFMREAETDIFGAKVPFRPIFRAGINYQVAPYSFLRASFGQGYRYPSLIEKYARKDIGGVGVYPNHDLKAESGLNAELGFKQGYKFGKVVGSIDVAGFYTQYSDMIEFRFGFFNNDTFENINSVKDVVSMASQGQMPGLGAQFYNVSKARIYGAEVSTTGQCKFNDHTALNYNLGYVFIEPEDADYKAKNEREDQYTDPLQMKEKSNRSKYLKYRQKHTFKAVLDFNWKRLDVGVNVMFKSKTLAVDYIMIDEREKEQPEIMDYVRTLLFGKTGVLTGSAATGTAVASTMGSAGNIRANDVGKGVPDGVTLASYWEEHNKPYCVVDLRLGVKISEAVDFQFMINNLLNQEYSTRPMAVAAPRTYLMQFNFNF